MKFYRFMMQVMAKRVVRLLIVVVALVALGALIFFGVRNMKELRSFGGFEKNDGPTIEDRVAILEAEVLGLRAQIGSILTFQRDSSFEEKQDFEKMMRELSEAKKAYTNNVNYSPILLALIELENKVKAGGNIEGEVLKMKAFSLNYPEILVQVMNIEGIKEVKTKDDLAERFGAFVRDARATAHAGDSGFWGKALAFLSRYFTILSRNDGQDAILFEMQKALDGGDWRKMAALGEEVQTGTQDSAAYLADINNLAKIKGAELGVYRAVSSALSR